MRMLECEKCQTENTLDHKFCRSCGQELNESERQCVRDEHNQLLKDAERVFALGRLGEVLTITQSILDVDPENVNALALLGDCFEREGRIADAVELYERLVALKPDGHLEKIRLDNLKKTLAAQEIAVAAPRDRKMGIAAGIAAIMLLSSVGAALLIASDSMKAEGDGEIVAKNEVVPFRTVAPVPKSGQAEDLSQAAGSTDPLLGVDNDPNDGLPNPGGSTRSSGSMGSARPINTVGPTNYGNQPFNPLPPGTTISPQLPQPGQNTGGGNSSTLPPVNGGNSDPAPNGQLNTPPVSNQDRDPGFIDIKVHPGGGSSNSGDDSGDEGNDADLSVTALIRKARNQYVTGDYSGAAAAYLEALRRGASPSSTNQRLAQCYEKLGKKNEAIAAYKRALASMEPLVSSGRATERTKTAYQACKDAISNLGG